MIAAQRAADICRGDPIENGKAKRQGQKQQGFLDMAPVRINHRDQAKKEAAARERTAHPPPPATSGTKPYTPPTIDIPAAPSSIGPKH